MFIILQNFFATCAVWKIREYHSEIAGEVSENICWIIISDIPDQVGISENTFPETFICVK